MKYFLIILCILSGVAPLNAVATNAPSPSGIVMVFGDSISSGYGLPPGSGWVSLLSKRLQERVPSHPVINASISGDTTSSGLARIEQSLQTHRPEIVIIELGGNDGLRGSSIDSIIRNLEALIESCHRRHAKVLLVGMHLPPNYGATYTQKFQEIFPYLAKKHQIKVVPFLLKGFGDQREFFLADGIHPNMQAQEKILENVWPTLRGMMK
jgi:acyl-CoA thioesterase-1